MGKIDYDNSERKQAEEALKDSEARPLRRRPWVGGR